MANKQPKYPEVLILDINDWSVPENGSGFGWSVDWHDDNARSDDEGVVYVNWNNHGEANEEVGGCIKMDKTGSIEIAGGSPPEVICKCYSDIPEEQFGRLFSNRIRCWMSAQGFEFIGWDKMHR